jgi:hypothetical protein
MQKILVHDSPSHCVEHPDSNTCHREEYSSSWTGWSFRCVAVCRGAGTSDAHCVAFEKKVELAFSPHDQGYHHSPNSAPRDGSSRSPSLSPGQTQPLASVISPYESKFYEGSMLGSQAFIAKMYRQLSHSGAPKFRCQHRSAKSMGFCLSGSSVRLIIVPPKHSLNHMTASNSWRSTSSHEIQKKASSRSPSCH